MSNTTIDYKLRNFIEGNVESNVADSPVRKELFKIIEDELEHAYSQGYDLGIYDGYDDGQSEGYDDGYNTAISEQLDLPALVKEAEGRILEGNEEDALRFLLRSLNANAILH